MADIKKFQFILDGKIANDFKSELNKLGGTINELNDTQVIVDFNENATMANFRKLYQKLEKENSDLTVQFRYDINKMMLEKAQKELSSLEVYADSDKANKEILELAKRLQDVKLKLDVEGISDDDIEKLETKAYRIVDKIGKILSTHISLDGSDKIFNNLPNEVKEIIETLTTLDEIKEIEPFDTKNIEKQLKEVKNIKRIMSDLEGKGAVSVTETGGVDESKVEELQKEIAEVKEDISSLKGRVDTLEDITAFDTLSSKASGFDKEVKGISQSVIDLQKVLIPLYDGINKVYKEKDGKQISGYWDTLKKQIDESDSELKELLKTIGLYDSESNSLNLIATGNQNSGGLIGDDKVLISRKKDLTSFEGTLKLKERLDEAYKAGVNVSRILDVIGTKESDVFLEIQERNHSSILGNINNADKADDWINPELFEATDKQLKKLIEDAIKLDQLGFGLDIHESNVLFDKEKGFSIIDLDLNPAKYENYAEFIDEIIGGLVGAYEIYYEETEKLSAKEKMEGTNLVEQFRERFVQLANTMQQAYAEAQDSHSPSKEFEKLENDAVDGIVEGANKNEDRLKNVGKQMADNIKEGFKEGISEIGATALSVENQSSVLSGDVNQIEDKIQDVGNGTKRIISEIGMSYDDFIQKVKSDNSLVERFAIFDKYGKVIDSLKGDLNSLVLPDNMNTSGAAKIVHSHPSMNALGGTFSEDDYLQWYSKFLSKGIGEQFELMWRGKSLKIDLSEVKDNLKSSIVSALVNISYVAGLQLETQDGEIPIPLSDVYNSLSNGLLKDVVEQNGGTVTTDIIDDVNNQVREIETLLSILKDFGKFRRANVNNDNAIKNRIEEYKSILKFLSEHEEYTYEQVQEILKYEKLNIMGTNSYGLNHNSMTLKNDTAEWMSEHLAEKYSELNGLGINSDNFDPFNITSDAEREYANITCKYYDALAEGMDTVIRRALEGEISEGDFVNQAMTSISSSISKVDNGSLSSAFEESSEYIRDYITTRFNQLKTDVPEAPLIEVTNAEEQVAKQSTETGNAIKDMISKFSVEEIEEMATALKKVFRGLVDVDDLVKSFGVTEDDLYTALDIVKDTELFDSLRNQTKVESPISEQVEQADKDTERMKYILSEYKGACESYFKTGSLESSFNISAYNDEAKSFGDEFVLQLQRIHDEAKEAFAIPYDALKVNQTPLSLVEESSGQLAMFDGVEEQQKEVKATIEKTNDAIEGQITLVDYLNDQKNKPVEPIKDTFDVNTESSEMDKVATATDEAVQAKKDFATANEGVQDSVDGSKSKLELEAELMEKLAKSAREAANAKKEFVKANKEVKDSEDTSDSKKSNVDKTIDKINSYNKTDSFFGFVKNGNLDNKRYQNISKEIESIIKKQGKYASSVKTTEEEIQKLDDATQKFADDFEEKFQKQQLALADNLENKIKRITSGKTFDEDNTKIISDIEKNIDKLRDINLFDANDLSTASQVSELISDINAGINQIKNVSNNPIALLPEPEDINKSIGQINKVLSGGFKLPRKLRTEFEQLRISYKNAFDSNGNVKITNAELQKLDNTLSKLNAEFEATGKHKSIMGSLTSRITDMNAKFLAQYFSFQDIVRYGQQGFETIKEYDKALTEMNKVSDESIHTLKEFQEESFGLADAVGTTASQIQNSTSDFLRLGESFEQAKQSAQDANALLKVSEFTDISEATDSLIAMSAAYDELEKSEINDILNYTGNNFSISTSELASALQRSAATLKVAGNDIYEATALVTAGNAVLQDAESVGTGKFMPEYIVICRFLYQKVAITVKSQRWSRPWEGYNIC